MLRLREGSTTGCNKLVSHAELAGQPLRRTLSGPAVLSSSALLARVGEGGGRSSGRGRACPFALAGAMWSREICSLTRSPVSFSWEAAVGQFCAVQCKGNAVGCSRRVEAKMRRPLGGLGGAPEGMRAECGVD